MRSTSKNKTLFWITLIVAAELTSFALLQKSVDSPVHSNVYIAIAILLFGLVVPLAFRETLRGTKIAISNFYWIIASELGSIALGYAVFKQKLTTKDYAAVVFLIMATMVQVLGN